MGIKHTKVSSVADGANSTLVRPSDWNDDHVIDGDVDFNGHAIVNVDAEGLIGEFTDLSDVPNSYAGAAGKVPTVNGGETGLEFTTPSVGGDSTLNWVTPQQYGAVADGTSHPLSEFYGSVAAAQAAYDGAFYFVTSLTQQIDYAATKAASNECFGGDTEIIEDYLLVGVGTSGDVGAFEVIINDGEPDRTVNELAGRTIFIKYDNDFVATSLITSNTARVITMATALDPSDTSDYAIGAGEHGENSHLNKVLYFPAGTYLFGSDTWLIRNLRSGRIEGAGKLATTLKADDIVLQFDGVWYTSISNMAFFLNGSGGTTCLDIDGNVPGHDYTTRGVQSVTLKDVFCYANESDYALAMCRQGGSTGQGSECIFIDCHLQGASFACYYQNGFNALANQFIGGNFQDYTKYGIYVLGGTFSCYGVGFQSTHGYTLYANGGYDIRCGDSGAGEGCPIYGCRSESSRFLLNFGAVTCDIRACIGTNAVPGWFTAVDYGPLESGREWIFITSADGFPTYMVATTGGTSGGVEPTWPDYGSGTTVNDGSVVWTETALDFVDNRSGSTDYRTVNGPGTVEGLPLGSLRIVTANTQFHSTDDVIQVNASGGPVSVALANNENKGHGRICTVLRRDTTTNAITVTSNFGHPETIGSLPTGRYGYRSYVRGQDNINAERWLLINTRFLQDMIAATPTAVAAETVTHYIEVNDGAGGTIKLAVLS